MGFFNLHLLYIILNLVKKFGHHVTFQIGKEVVDQVPTFQ